MNDPEPTASGGDEPGVRQESEPAAAAGSPEVAAPEPPELSEPSTPESTEPAAHASEAIAPETSAAAGSAEAHATEPGDRRKKRRRNKRGGAGAGDKGPGDPGGEARGPRPPREAPHGGAPGRSFVEDRIDREAEHLAREARTVPTSRVRSLGILAQEVRRLVASGDPRDAREARRALVLMKSRVAYLAGREHGRERAALLRVRDFVFRGVDVVTRNHDAPDPAQLRNFLDQVEAFIGYHRFHADDRRRD